MADVQAAAATAVREQMMQSTRTLHINIVCSHWDTTASMNLTY